MNHSDARELIERQRTDVDGLARSYDPPDWLVDTVLEAFKKGREADRKERLVTVSVQLQASDIQKAVMDEMAKFTEPGIAEAITTLNGLGYTYEGGELWQPPIDKACPHAAACAAQGCNQTGDGGPCDRPEGGSVVSYVVRLGPQGKAAWHHKQAAENDAETHGVGFLVDGYCIAPERVRAFVRKTPHDAEVIESQPINPIGDTVKAVFLVNHNLSAGQKLYAWPHQVERRE
jgi:hypothetical protein